jgi:hypothetical protein
MLKDDERRWWRQDKVQYEMAAAESQCGYQIIQNTSATLNLNYTNDPGNHPKNTF